MDGVDGFEKRVLINVGSFEALLAATVLEPLGPGRHGAVIVRCSEEGVPLVRTTTTYEAPAQHFRPLHDELVREIEAAFFGGRSVGFNNALVELYEPTYRKMGFHTDQSQDLREDSFICLFSCYEDVSPKNGLRTLRVEKKATKEGGVIVLDHNSAVTFSTAVNRAHVHKIMLERNSASRWLGITLRCSKSFVKFVGRIPFLRGKELLLASAEQKRELQKHKGAENAKDGVYEYPDFDFAISKSNLMEPV